MSQRIRNTIPFYRRALPWFFIIVFLLFAPAVVFYTSGYRWNPKKGKVDRNGTVILDSTPRGATITIDGRPTDLQTPATIQDMPPGMHHFQLSRAGYRSWEKTLEVRPERVTFANRIWLWRETTPERISEINALALSIIPNQERLLALTVASPTQATFLDTQGRIEQHISLSKQIIQYPSLIWSPNGRGVLIESSSPLEEEPWVIDVRTAREPFTLPRGLYRWSRNELLGRSTDSLFSIDLADVRLNQERLATEIADRAPEAELRTATHTTQLIYISHDDPTRGFVLPSGDWRFWSFLDNVSVLRDGSRWLAVRLDTQTPEYHILRGRFLREIPEAKEQQQFLAVNGTELWIWDLLSDPQLVHRQSEQLIDAVWGPEGTTIFFATPQKVFALDLDPRDGHLTTELAQFDIISGLTVLDRQLFIAGSQQGESGIWKLDLE